MMPCLASIAACALLAAMSWRNRCRSKSIEALISSMTASGLALKRPPHILLLMIRPLGTSTEVLPTVTGPAEAARTHANKRLVMVVAGGIAGVAVGLAAVYGIGRFQ